MKPSVTPDATRAVLADIADAVRPVERARTAAAVDRVIASACESLKSRGISTDVCGVSLCDCEEARVVRDHATPGLDVAVWVLSRAQLSEQRRRYAPWVVSPHLFDTRSDPTPSGSNQRRRVTTQQQGEYQ